MAEPVLWQRDDHTAAKHRVLVAYLNAWIPIMAQQSKRAVEQGLVKGPPRILIVDGFAGPGRYAGGELGSPLLMIQALLEHDRFPALEDVEFLFLFIEQDGRRVQHLEDEIAQMDLPANVHVEIQHGTYEEHFGELIDGIHEQGHRLVPTFAFIDPFGYAHASMSLAGKFFDFPRGEALIFLPLSYIHRFVGREGQENALNTLFGSDAWRDALKLSGQERRDFLLELFEDELRRQGSIDFVRSFGIRTKDGNDYRLVFAGPHIKGLDAMKDAMWSVDPVAGTHYVATRPAGDELLFTPPDQPVDTRPLLADLRDQFGTDWFTIEEAEEFTLLQTPYRKGHLKQKTLAPAATAGELEKECPPGRRGFVAGTRLRFTR